MQGKTLTDDYLAVGKIVKPHGIKGELKVVPYSGAAEELLVFKTFFVQSKSTCERYNVLRNRAQGKFTILQVSGVTSRNAAEDLVGDEVFVLLSDMPELEDDQFYWHEMVGINVVTDNGQKLGQVTSLLDTGANDVLVVSGTGHEYLLPVIDEIIVSVDKEEGVLVVSPFPGLLDINKPE